MNANYSLGFVFADGAHANGRLCKYVFHSRAYKIIILMAAHFNGMHVASGRLALQSGHFYEIMAS